MNKPGKNKMATAPANKAAVEEKKKDGNKK